MNFVLLQIELQQRNQGEIFWEIQLYTFDQQLVRLGLLYGLSKSVVGLVQQREFSLVHHREVCPEFNYLTSLQDGVPTLTRKPEPRSNLGGFCCHH